MTNALAIIPAPVAPVPPDCDLRGYDWFPLFHKRLRRSSFWKNATDTVARISVDFWCESYEQVPAASLPDDDAFLSELAGYGRRDLKAWSAVKEDVMSAWVQIDGRWYHPVLCEVALEAWGRRKKELEEREAARIRKRRSRGSTPIVTRDQKLGHEDDVAPERDVTRETSLTETATVTRTEEEKKDPPEGGAREGALPLGDQGAPGAKPDAKGLPVREAFDAYNAAAGLHGWAIAKDLTEARRKKLQARLKDQGLTIWLSALTVASESSFLMGRASPKPGQPPFRLDLDFLLQASSFQKLIEGKYDDRIGPDGGLGKRGSALRNLHAAAVDLGDDSY